MNLHKSEGIAENITLPPDFLSLIDSKPIEECLLHLVGCPEYRPDLIETAKNTTEQYILHQIEIIKTLLIDSEDRPEGISDDDLLAISAYTLESSIYKLVNAWGNMGDMKYVAPYLKFLLEALRRLPESYRYQGFGVRILDTTTHMNQVAWDNYKEHFAKGKPVNFHSVCSFGRDEKLLNNFIKKGIDHPVIVLKCENISGYLIENISMMPRLGNKNDGEVLVEGPAFFNVKSEPIQIQNFVFVDITFNEKISHLRAYLPYKKSKSLIEQEKKKEKRRKKKRKGEKENREKKN